MWGQKRGLNLASPVKGHLSPPQNRVNAANMGRKEKSRKYDVGTSHLLGSPTLITKSRIGAPTRQLSPRRGNILFSLPVLLVSAARDPHAYWKWKMMLPCRSSGQWLTVYSRALRQKVISMRVSGRGKLIYKSEPNWEDVVTLSSLLRFLTLSKHVSRRKMWIIGWDESVPEYLW